MSKSGSIYNKKNNYLVKLIGCKDYEINYLNNRKEYNLLPGKYQIKIGNEASFQIKDIELKNGETKKLTINPSITYNLGKGMMIGFAVTALIVQFLILKKISIPLMMIPFIPLFLVRKKHFADSFTISIN